MWVCNFSLIFLPLGSGSVDPHIFADSDPGEAKMLRFQLILILSTELRMKMMKRRKQYSSLTNPILSIFSQVWPKVNILFPSAKVNLIHV